MAKGNPSVTEHVERIVKPQSFEELRASVSAFLDFADANNKYTGELFQQLLQALVRFGKPYLEPLPTQNNNVIFIPPEDAPVMTITTCVPISDDPKVIMTGLKRFTERCDEFSSPIEAIISEAEMDLVLATADKRFGILDIIAKFRPLKILSFHNSHHMFNCECGITDNYSKEAFIFVYHPREISVYDRFFIFAHEIGHALHLALTHDIDRIPKRFDDFNESLGITGMSTQEKQESFADAVAIAILYCDELQEHLPNQLHKQLPPYFEKYIKFLTDDYFKTLHWER